MTVFPPSSLTQGFYALPWQLVTVPTREHGLLYLVTVNYPSRMETLQKTQKAVVDLESLYISSEMLKNFGWIDKITHK